MQNETFFVYQKLHQYATGNGFETKTIIKETVVFNLNELDKNENKISINLGMTFEIPDMYSDSAGYYAHSKRQLFIPLLKVKIKCKH